MALFCVLKQDNLFSAQPKKHSNMTGTHNKVPKLSPVEHYGQIHRGGRGNVS